MFFPRFYIFLILITMGALFQFLYILSLVIKSECWLWERDCISQYSLFRFTLVSPLRPKNIIKHRSWVLNINLEWNWSFYWRLLLRQVPLLLPFLVFQVKIRPLQWNGILYTMQTNWYSIKNEIQRGGG